jgi:mxaJ protein
MMIALSALLLAAAQPAPAEELRVCADPNNMPFSNARGEGFENRIVEAMAADFGMKVHYEWWAQRRGSVRQTLNAGLCDVIPGVGSTLEMLATTRPYYRASYMFVSREDHDLAMSSFDDARLKALRIGVQMIGDDGSNTPPAHALAKRGIVENVRGYMIYGDYGQPDPQGRIMEAVECEDVDVALVWGPVAGYFAKHSPVPLRIMAVTPWLDGPLLPMAFDVSMGVRKADLTRRRQIDDWLKANTEKIRVIMAELGIDTASVEP